MVRSEGLEVKFLHGRPTVVKQWGLCAGCLVRHPPEAVEGRNVYLLAVPWFGERLPITSALCAECWRLLRELRGVDLGLVAPELES